MRYPALATTLLLVAALQPATPAWGVIKCWTNAEGNKECGDKVPPEYSKTGHEVRSEEGVVVDQVDGAASPEEIQRLRAEQAAAEQQRMEAEKQRRLDEVLLQTFSEESDIVRSQEDKVSILEGQITLAGERIKKLKAQLEKIQERVKVYQEKEQDIPASLVKGEISAQNQIDDNNKFITDKRLEQEQIVESHQAQLARFRELTAGGGLSNAPTAETPP